MPNRIDELFSSERLHRAWSMAGLPANTSKHDLGTKPDAAGPGSKPKTALDAHALFEQLARLVDERFPVGQAEGLHVLMAELGELLWKRFPRDGGSEAPGPDKAALDQTIWDMLNRIEDVLDALDLAGQSGGK
jgi:hypothetical protein